MLFRNTLLAIAAMALSSSPSLAGDSVIGKLDLKSGTFTPLPAAAGATQVYSGTVKVTYSILVKTLFPANQKFLCSLALSVYDSTTYTQGPTASATEEGLADGTKLTCIIAIPYAWSLKADSTTMISGSWSVTAAQSNGASRSIGAEIPSANPEATPNPSFIVKGEI